MKTLDEYNKEISTAGIACPKCEDFHEMHFVIRHPVMHYDPSTSDNVICLNCGYKGRKKSIAEYCI